MVGRIHFALYFALFTHVNEQRKRKKKKNNDSAARVAAAVAAAAAIRKFLIKKNFLSASAFDEQMCFAWSLVQADRRSMKIHYSSRNKLITQMESPGQSWAAGSHWGSSGHKLPPHGCCCCLCLSRPPEELIWFVTCTSSRTSAAIKSHIIQLLNIF